MKYDYTDDKQYAYDICRKHPPALARIQSEFADRLYTIADKLCNTREFEDGWQYQTVTGKTINIGDCESDTYLWLMTKQVILNACKYEGLNQAKLETYLISILNSSYTFNGWLKRKYGNSYTIPKCIREMKEEYWEAFKMMRMRKTVEIIAVKLGKENSEIEEMKNEIRAALAENNLLYMIESVIITGLYKELDSDEDGEEINIKSPDEIRADQPSRKSESLDVKSKIKKSIDHLEVWDRSLLTMYWADNMSTAQIIQFIKTDGHMRNLDNLKIVNDKDIYSNITRIIKILYQYIEKEHTIFLTEYNLDERVLRQAVKIYLENF